MKGKLKKKQKKVSKRDFDVFLSPAVYGLTGFLPYIAVIILVAVIAFSVFEDDPQKNLLGINFENQTAASEVARDFLEKGDTELAKVVYSKMIDGVNMSSGKMSVDWVDGMIMNLNPRVGMSEDLRTKSMMSETIKSKALYLRLADMFEKLGFKDEANEARLKALEIDPVD